jgi:tRNA pseudouridine(38-40) synthase
MSDRNNEGIATLVDTSGASKQTESPHQPSPTTEVAPQEGSPPGKNKTKRKRNDTSDVTWRSRQRDSEYNTGSYANPEQRSLYNIQLPSFVTEQEDGKDAEPDTPKRVKKKVAFLLAYVGTNYGGFQINDGQRTPQAEFELAMLRTRLLLPCNFGSPHKYSWSTSGRTDKGVHACAQVVSAKVELLPDQTMAEVRDEMNTVLPDDVRVLDVVRTTRNFCAKTQRDRVRYQYMIPSFVFADADTLRVLFKDVVGHSNRGQSKAELLLPEELKSVQSALKDFKANPMHIAKLQEALQVYEGTHAFHNFSRGVKSNEARAARYIERFHVEEPIVFPNGVEWIPTQVLGQSFLLNQIRKMVCMAMDVARGVVPLTNVSRALERQSDVRINVAPAQGLFLEMSYYGGYNRRKLTSHNDLEDLDWADESTEAYQRWNDFRHNRIMQHIAEEEDSDGNFVKYLFQQEYVFEASKQYQSSTDRLPNEKEGTPGSNQQVYNNNDSV